MINGIIIGIVIVTVLVLILLVFYQNRKDKKDLEQKLNDPDIEPEKHDRKEE